MSEYKKIDNDELISLLRIEIGYLNSECERYKAALIAIRDESYMKYWNHTSDGQQVNEWPAWARKTAHDAVKCSPDQTDNKRDK
jgi:hypothetical protein